MIDTHSHPYLKEFEDGGVGAIDRAVANGVEMVILPNVDASTLSPMLNLHKKRSANTRMALGLHPTEVTPGWEKILDEMETQLENGDFIAVGEVGMDLYWDKTYREEQMKAFARQLRIADRLGLPVIIHCRDALDETLEVIKDVSPGVNLIFHSFTGSAEDVRKIRDVCNPMFGINGVVTFKNAGCLRDAIPEIGADYILLETDSPYLAPVPHRGKRNESSYLPFILQCVASSLSLPCEEMEKITDRNAISVFRLDS